MSFTVEQLAGEPIVHIQLIGETTAADVVASREAAMPLSMAILTEDPSATVYVVIDNRQIKTSFVETLNILRSQVIETTASQLPVQFVMVGSDASSRMFVNALANEAHGGIRLPLYLRLEDALDYIRTNIALNRQQSGESSTNHPT